MPKIAIVGGGPGIGLSVARRFAERGFEPHLFTRRGPEMEADALRAEGHKAHAHRLDAGDMDAVADVLGALAPVDVLVWNAVGVTPGSPLDLSPSALVADFRIGVAGVVAAVRSLVPTMPAGGSVLLTGGGYALHPATGLASLGVAKAGLRNLAMTLSESLAPRGIRAGTITVMGIVAPGTAFDSAHVADAFWAMHEDRERALGFEIRFHGRAA
ncbi:MAG: SDR family NAD(P)-dependent oxidoreductase [Thermaurantiacus sp.]